MRRGKERRAESKSAYNYVECEIRADVELSMMNGNAVVLLNWAGDIDKATGDIEKLAARNVTTIIHRGEYGIRPDDFGHSDYLERIDSACERHNVTVWIHPGRTDVPWVFPTHQSPRPPVIGVTRQFIHPNWREVSG
ncbi:MAG: hypothetical protein ACTHON_17540 [Humibacter sp.]